MAMTEARPAGLAIADDRGLALGLGMARRDLAQELRLAPGDVVQRLPGDRIGLEGDEVDRVARLHRDADLARLLHAADARPVAGARVEDHEGALPGIDLDTRGRQDAQQHVVRRPRQFGAVHHHLVVEAQDGRLARLVVFRVLVAALAQGVEKEDGALDRVDPVSLHVHGAGEHLEDPSNALRCFPWQLRPGGRRVK